MALDLHVVGSLEADASTMRAMGFTMKPTSAVQLNPEKPTAAYGSAVPGG
jgi:hypothetical protein